MKQAKIVHGVQVLFLVVLLVAAGCVRTRKQSELMRETQATELSSVQLRLLVYAFAVRFSDVVEQAADEIFERADERDIRRLAVLWKANAVPVVQRAAFVNDPLAGLVDVWALCEQQKDFFETGGGRDLFADQQRIAVDAARVLVREVLDLAVKVSRTDDISEFQGKLETWTDHHPIERISFARPSTQSLLALWVKGRSRGAGAVIGSLDEGLSDLSSRLAIYAESMPKQMRWQGELLYDETLKSPEARQSLANLDVLAYSLDRTATGVEELPDEVVERVQPVLEGIGEEREALTAFADAQRREVQDFARAERIAVMAVLQSERIEALKAIRAERVDTLERLDALVASALDRGKTDVAELIDHAMLRAALLLGGLLAVLGLVGIVALRVLVVAPLLSRPAD